MGVSVLGVFIQRRWTDCNRQCMPDRLRGGVLGKAEQAELLFADRFREYSEVFTLPLEEGFGARTRVLDKDYMV